MCVLLTTCNCSTQYSSDSYDNLPSYPSDIHHNSDDVYWRESREEKKVPNDCDQVKKLIAWCVPQVARWIKHSDYILACFSCDKASAM